MRYMLISIISVILACDISGEALDYWQKIELIPGALGPHVLSVKVKDSEILVGTSGQGAYFSSGNGENWRQFKTSPANDSTSLGFDYIIGGDWDDSEIVLATLGDGLNISSDAGTTWKRFGYDYFGVEYLYTVGAIINNGRKFIPTADGIVYFDGSLDKKSNDKIVFFEVIAEKKGLASQYIYDMAITNDSLFVGTLHGFSVSPDLGKSWRNYNPNGMASDKVLALCKTRAVAVDSNFWYAGCDDGLFVSTDQGISWRDISKGLPSKFVHDILIDDKHAIWVATYKGVANSADGGKSYKVYGKESGFYGENINCLAQLADGSIIAGTNYGLYNQTDKRPAPNMYPQPRALFDKTELPIHQWLSRPLSPSDNDQKDQTYLYGCTMGGNFRQHQGCEFNNPEGVSLVAVDNGVIVFTEPEIGHAVLKCDTRFQDYYVYVHYHHQQDILKKAGDRVKRGELIGHIGKKGNVTNEHLHFELAISKTDDTNVPDKTVNSELWVAALPGCGTIVGNVVDLDNKPIRKIKIYGVEKPVPTETPFSYAESYGDSVNPSPAYGENFVIADVPSGNYLIWVERNSAKYAVNVKVETGKVTRAKIVAGQ
jgi:murein DD-endopeptidase MepM/ murein hydrolase activator NlpD